MTIEKLEKFSRREELGRVDAKQGNFYLALDALSGTSLSYQIRMISVRRRFTTEIPTAAAVAARVAMRRDLCPAVVLLFVVGIFQALENPCAAGIIFPSAMATSPDQFQTIDEARTVAVEQESGAGAAERRAPEVEDSPVERLDLAGYMAADTSGCGTPTLPTGGASTGWLAAFDGSETSRVRTPDLSGRVITELNLTLPVLAPSQLLDPPRVSG